MVANLGAMLLIGAGLPAFLLLVAISLPGLVSQAEQVIQVSNYRLMGWSLAMGAMLVGGLVILAAIAKPLAVMGMLIAGLIMACGFTAIVKRLAFRLFSPGGRSPFYRSGASSFSFSGGGGANASAAQPTLRQFVMASLVLELAMFLPILGWFVALPVGLLLALGTGCAALWQQWQATARPPLIASRLGGADDLGAAKKDCARQFEVWEQPIR